MRALAMAEAGAVEDDDAVGPEQGLGDTAGVLSSPATALPCSRTMGCPVPRSL